MLNRNYGKLTDGEITYAPSQIKIGNTYYPAPTAEQYLACDSGPWKAVITAGPAEPAPSGSHYEPDGWDETDTTITRKWKVVADPVIPRKWTQLKIETALGMAGKSVDAFHNILKDIELWSGYTAFRAYDIADFIEEGYPNEAMWNIILDTVASRAGGTRADLDAFLDTIPTEV